MSSQRLRIARQLLDGVRQGQSLGALLGYRFERGLHDARPMLDRYLPRLRELAPVLATRIDVAGGAREVIATTGTVDGLALHRQRGQINWRTDPRLPSPPSPDYQAIQSLFDDLDDAVDALADAMLAESVHHAVQGNPFRAGASLDAASRGHVPPPDLEFVRTPRTGIGVTHRVLLLTNPGAVDRTTWPVDEFQVRAVADPHADFLASSLLPAPRRVRARVIWSQPSTESQASVQTYLTLDVLQLSALDYVLLPGGDQLAEDTELVQRIVSSARTATGPQGVDASWIVHVDVDRDADWPTDVLSVQEFASAAAAVHRLLNSGHQLSANDLITPDEATPDLTSDASLTARAAAATENAAVVAAALGAEAGQHFLRLLAAQKINEVGAAFTGAMPFIPPAMGASDVANDRRLAMFVNRVPDSRQLAAAFGPRPVIALPPNPAIPKAQQDAVLVVANRWVRWYTESVTLATPESSSWLDNRMEYAFALAAHDTTGEIVLTADEYDGGRLDWLDLDIAPGDSLGASPASETRIDTLMPTSATYAGMPAARWWECEETRIIFGALDAEPTDLARMMLVEFATAYGNDSFIIPIELPVGTLNRIVSLVVTDTFGEQMLIPPATGGGWSLFTPSVSGSTESLPVLALMPTVADSIDGAALEEVLLVRDEMANMAWGIETHVTGPAGLAVDRQATLAQAAAAPMADNDAPQLQYRLAKEVPENWLPLIPAQVNGEARLVRVLQQRVDDGQVVGIPPAGRLLAPDGLWLYPEEVPAAGARVTRGWQVARSPDGKTHLWLGRAKSAGRGPGSSGLRFDIVDP